MKIMILGAGCERCDNLYANTVVAIRRIQGVAGDAEVEKVTDPEVFYRYKVAITPALVVNDEVISVGKVLTPDQIETELRKHASGGSS
jgi:hypothetical protein